jgi:hypothetical protein
VTQPATSREMPRRVPTAFPTRKGFAIETTENANSAPEVGLMLVYLRIPKSPANPSEMLVQSNYHESPPKQWKELSICTVGPFDIKIEVLLMTAIRVDKG